MLDWQHYTQSILFGLIVSFLLAKLFSIIFSFRDQNLRITRANPNENEPYESPEEKRSGGRVSRDYSTSDEEQPLIVGEKDKERIISDDDEDESDDDWEGAESTELDEVFSAATAFVAGDGG
ncbi:hypothetical protein L1987_76133 [Smallanthus sonchifolius]|uniref:Uncharacterized protein n=1 Tax=Smallanthus sonchifolius TaxID=185202 RepID=A0ACB9A6N3_9ASTR|nr:hypothetical protein L1987_76133 [Smallanthus sonchifolius]